MLAHHLLVRSNHQVKVGAFVLDFIQGRISHNASGTSVDFNFSCHKQWVIQENFTTKGAKLCDKQSQSTQPVHLIFSRGRIALPTDTSFAWPTDVLPGGEDAGHPVPAPVSIKAPLSKTDQNPKATDQGRRPRGCQVLPSEADGCYSADVTF